MKTCVNLQLQKIVNFLIKIQPGRKYNLKYITTKLNQLKLFSNQSYGFIDRCIDGIQLNIDSITVTIKSQKFNANLIVIQIEISKIIENNEFILTDVQFISV